MRTRGAGNGWFVGLGWGILVSSIRLVIFLCLAGGFVILGLMGLFFYDEFVTQKVLAPSSYEVVSLTTQRIMEEQIPNDTTPRFEVAWTLGNLSPATIRYFDIKAKMYLCATATSPLKSCQVIDETSQTQTIDIAAHGRRSGVSNLTFMTGTSHLGVLVATAEVVNVIQDSDHKAY